MSENYAEEQGPIRLSAHALDVRASQQSSVAYPFNCIEHRRQVQTSPNWKGMSSCIVPLSNRANAMFYQT